MFRREFIVVFQRLFLCFLILVNGLSACRHGGKSAATEPAPTAQAPTTPSDLTENQQDNRWLFGYDFPQEDSAGEAAVLNSLRGLWGGMIWTYTSYNERQVPSREGLVINPDGTMGMATMLYENVPLGIFPPSPQSRYAPTHCIFTNNMPFKGVRVSKDLGSMKPEFTGYRLIEFRYESAAESESPDVKQIIVSTVKQNPIFETMARDGKRLEMDITLRVATTAKQKPSVAEFLNEKGQPSPSIYNFTGESCPQ